MSLKKNAKIWDDIRYGGDEWQTVYGMDNMGKHDWAVLHSGLFSFPNVTDAILAPEIFIIKLWDRSVGKVWHNSGHR